MAEPFERGFDLLREISSWWHNNTYDLLKSNCFLSGKEKKRIYYNNWLVIFIRVNYNNIILPFLVFVMSIINRKYPNNFLTTIKNSFYFLCGASLWKPPVDSSSLIVMWVRRMFWLFTLRIYFMLMFVIFQGSFRMKLVEKLKIFLFPLL